MWDSLSPLCIGFAPRGVACPREDSPKGITTVLQAKSPGLQVSSCPGLWAFSGDFLSPDLFVALLSARSSQPESL